MLIKLGIIAAVLVLGGMMFSTEITSLFPSTSALLADSLKNDIDALNSKVTNSAENRLDSSIDQTIQGVSDSVYQGITETGDKLVENVNELMGVINKLKPSSSKGTYVKSLTVSSGALSSSSSVIDLLPS